MKGKSFTIMPGYVPGRRTNPVNDLTKLVTLLITAMALPSSRMIAAATHSAATRSRPCAASPVNDDGGPEADELSGDGHPHTSRAARMC